MADPINVRLLDDLPVENDEFGGHRRVANAIADLILNEHVGGKAIAIEGGWGFGKSSVVKMLEKRRTSFQATVLVFDAWSHEGDPLRRVFLEELTSLCAKKLDNKRRDAWDERKKKEITGRLRTVEQSSKPILRSRWPLLVLAFTTLYPIAIALLGVLFRAQQVPLLPYFFFLLLVVAILPFVTLVGLFFYAKGKVELSKAGKWISLWNKHTDETVTTTAHENAGPTSIEFQAYFTDLLREYLEAGHQRVVIVLDNLDRVPESVARTLWSTLRLFADICETKSNDWAKRVWFVVPYDRVAAASLWQNETKGNAPKEDSGDNPGRQVQPPSVAAAFLDKTFQIRFSVPPLHIAEWEQYLKKLLQLAMPDFGGLEEKHRVYRLSQVLADEKRRSPSPRHLKLYVNDIGALARQFREFPLDHLALYAILQRQDKDVRLSITSGECNEDALARVMPDASHVDSLLALYFGTEDIQRAKTLTLVEPLNSAIRAGDGERLKSLALIPGFWSVAEQELGKPLQNDQLHQDAVVNLANALTISSLQDVAEESRRTVLPNLARRALEQANWRSLDMNSGTSARSLLKVANSPDATRATFDRLVTDTLRDQTAVDVERWAAETRSLAETARELDHPVRIRIPHAGDLTIDCLSAINTADFSDTFVQLIELECSAADLQVALTAAADREWTIYQNAALSSVKRMSKPPVRFEELITPFANRLQQDVSEEEAVRLIDAIFDLVPHIGDICRSVIGDVARHPSFYKNVQRFRDNGKVTAKYVAVGVMAQQLDRAVSEPETKGRNVIAAWLSKPDEDVSAVNDFATIAFERPHLGLVEATADHHNAMGTLGVKFLQGLADRNGVGDLIGAPAFYACFGQLENVLSDSFQALVRRLLESDRFRDSLVSTPVRLSNPDPHRLLIQSAALDVEGYRGSLFKSLQDVDATTWQDEIANPSSLYELLRLAIQHEFNELARVADAVQATSAKLCGNEPPQTSWSTAPANWETVRMALPPHRIKTAAGHVVDQLEANDLPEGLSRAIGLMGSELPLEFANRSHEALVRRIAEPIAKAGDSKLVGWLISALEQGKSFWDAATDADRSTFCDTLRQRFDQDGQSEETKGQFRRIAELLALPKLDREMNEAPVT